MIIRQGRARVPVTEVVLHCAALSEDQVESFAKMTPMQVRVEIEAWHKQRGFSQIGYHGIFMPDGTFITGRPYEVIGAHVIEKNRGTLGFLMIESKKITKIGKFTDWFTEAQRRAVRMKISDFDGITKVSGHNDYANKLCPGFRVETGDWL